MFLSQETCRYLSTGDILHAAGSTIGAADSLPVTWNWSYSIEGAGLRISAAFFTVSEKKEAFFMIKPQIFIVKRRTLT